MSNPWIKHEGGECPIEDGVRFEMCFRSGSKGEALKASDYRWTHEGKVGDITHYRLIEQEQSELEWLQGEMRKKLTRSTKLSEDDHPTTDINWSFKGEIRAYSHVLDLIKTRLAGKP